MAFRWGTKSLLEATFRRALNFLLALSSKRRDSQKGQLKFRSIASSIDGSKTKNGRRSGATACLQPRSPGPQTHGTTPAFHAGFKFSACDFGYRAGAGVRPAGGAFAPAGLENTISRGNVRGPHYISWIAFRQNLHQALHPLAGRNAGGKMVGTNHS